MKAPLDTDVAVETPEHIVFSYRLAGPVRRGLANLLDLLLCYAVVALVALLVFAVVIGANGASPSEELSEAAKAASGLLLLLLFAAQWLYFFLWEALLGRSPGKMALGLRVVTTEGRAIGFRAAAVRNLLRAADLLPTAYVIGFVSMALSSKFQRLGDLAASTMVVIPERTSRMAPLELTPPATSAELSTLPDEVLLDEDERIAIEMFLRRRYTLGRAREHELAEMIAGPIGARLGYRHSDPSRLLALVYDRAVNRGRVEAPSSSWRPGPKSKKPAASKKETKPKGGAAWR
ncbi:INTEGRAL MEMBRANE PROTEIN (Rhomboid family) [Labilithrix luteola]|uniref:INTEGRAL MEMBRANE PROTEIN (Rhomboid family) n=1 Tax=Labilithrix luteola TaxID=1391654 RepID=A0A0K1QH08_9BACT|nr:RDD family protein [Labilithrix luteola]AKV04705.1 INTEGRAL MEMBRANE PROTEIN (Rhomboid family) [Labilithrix luteola]